MPSINVKVDKTVKADNSDDKFPPIPEGMYNVVAIESVVKPTRAGDGSYLMFTFEIIDEGEWRGRWVWDRFNLDNPVPDTVEKAERNFSRFCLAAGIDGTVTDSETLHHRPVMVKISQREWNGRIFNDVKFYKEANVKDSAPVGFNSDNVPF